MKRSHNTEIPYQSATHVPLVIPHLAIYSVVAFQEIARFPRFQLAELMRSKSLYIIADYCTMDNKMV